VKPSRHRQGRTALRYRHLAGAIALSAAVVAGCGVPSGQPRAGSEPLAPREVVEFAALYGDNCAGCHGTNGRGGAAIALADPVYLGIVDESAMRDHIANGVSGTSMPAFAQRAGGILTEQQVSALVSGIRSHWSRPGILDNANPPSYAARSAGDVRRGEAAYQTYCESCHGPGGQGGPKGSAITNDSVLALSSDQGLRTIVIAGRPELGAPDWRGNVAGRPMSEQEITDVVSWLASHRIATPGRPYVTGRGE
jgi:cytochrome c oxidase cbb3-type subunit III